MAGEHHWKVYLTSGNNRRLIREFVYFDLAMYFVESQKGTEDCEEYEVSGGGYRMYYTPQSQKWTK